MTERDDFDKIVEGLDLDLSFVDEPLEPVDEASEPTWTPRTDDDVEAEEPEEPFYRKVEPTPLIPRRRGIMLAWAGVLGAPLSLVIATLSGVFLDRPIVAAASLTFVACAIYLILQLPEHGPSRKDWPDDGAVL
ncbi:hypothetical protein ASC61_15210 [Aeromicrobium sp. Root344]|uniref:hypothetical protein n=1 Tax=Aeromicrobium sp. Root344 TaxID=1736521 RepID=UPI0006F620BA|nr:hypothetical protein [Aeromicrobium sp. Root344]KQV76235.1 hypothetical protein ASC61_15210 [Aeromicrobium sp. Root344]